MLASRLSQRSNQRIAVASKKPGSPLLAGQAEWPSQFQAIFSGTPLRLRTATLR